MANLRTNNLCGRGFVSVNDGTIWSSLFDGSTLGSYPVTNAFDGDVSTLNAGVVPLNEWVHGAVSHDTNTTTLRIYKNGLES